MPKIDDTELYPYIDYINENDPVDEAIRRADEAAQTATAASVTANAAAQTATAASVTANAAAQTANEAAQEVESAIDNFEGGYYPEQTVGMADTLMSGDTEIVQFAQRTSDRDGMARVESLRGNTVRFNQLFNNMYSIDTGAGVTATKNSDGSYTISGTSTQQNVNTYMYVTRPTALDSNHKYYIRGANTINANAAGAYGGYNLFCVYDDKSASFAKQYGNAIIIVPDSAQASTFGIRIQIGYGSVGVTFNDTIFINIIDLTTMFGAGNEPATVEEFERMFPEDYYPYDAGSLLSVNLEGIQSAGMTRDIPASTYFPDGLRSAGTAYDELDFVNHKAITRIGAVDLGTLNWARSLLNGAMSFYVTFSDAMLPSSNSKVANITTLGYSILSANDLYIHTTDTKIMSLNRQHGLQVRDADYTEAATFKAAMSGVMLYYELAALTETDLPEILQATYPVEIGGTESIVIPTGEQSAPPTFVIVYAYDANGIIDKSQSIIAPIEHGTASDNYAIDSYLVMSGVLYRVTSAIASGETITPDTNCVATTVTAEMVRLTA